ERMPALVEVGDDRLHAPVAVAVDHVAGVAAHQQLRVVALVFRQFAPPGPDPVGGELVGRVRLLIVHDLKVSLRFRATQYYGHMADRDAVECWLTDMDGVLVRESKPIPGASELLQQWREQGKRFLVLTNNSIFTPRDLSARLRASGLIVPE